jgi:HEAT-like repeat
MVFSEDEIERMEAADDDNQIKPRFHKTKSHELSTVPNQPPAQDEEEDDDDEEEEDEDFDEWNLRKCSAASLDMLSSVFGDDLLPHMLPTVNQMLASPQWQIQEAGVLAIGAVAMGCNSGMQVHLPGLIPHLTTMLECDSVFIKSITCWTLGRYISWILGDKSQPQLVTYFYPLLERVLRRCLEGNRQVQKAACSALATLQEEAGEVLGPSLKVIVETLSQCLDFYQKRNLMVLYDAFSTLAESAGEELNQPVLVGLFMPRLMEKWRVITDDDYGLFPLLECLTSISVAIGPGFAPFAQEVWGRCTRLIQVTLQAYSTYDNDSSLMMPDKDFIMVSLDLMSGVIQALGMLGNELVGEPTEPTVFSILKVTMKDSTADVRSSSFALLGDLCVHGFGLLVPHLNEIMELVLINLSTVLESGNISAMNNATWSAGEIAMQYCKFLKV